MNKKHIIIPVVTLFAGLAIGASGSETATEPAVTEAPKVKTVTETVEVEVEVEVTPQACLDALDYADEGFGYAEQTMGIVIDAFDAIGNLDYLALDEATADIQAVTADLESVAPLYIDAKTECRDNA